MLMIRLQPRGKKGQKVYRIIVSEKQKDVFGDYLEQVGFYDPNPSPSKVAFVEDRVKYYLGNGAQPSDTVHNLLVDAGIVKADKLRKGNSNRGKSKQGDEEGETKAEGDGKPADAVKEEVKAEAPEVAPKEDKQEKPKEEAKGDVKAEEQVVEKKVETKPAAEEKKE